MGVFLMLFLGVGLMLAPLLAPLAGYTLSGPAAVACILTGAALTLLVGIVLVFTRLYRKTKASEAFVRTGSGGVRVIRDGGAIFIPVLHEMVRVSLETLKLEVSREQDHALITKDKLRADIRAEFFVRVQPDRDSILQASRSLGERMSDPLHVKKLIEDKLVSALRTAAAGKTLEQLNSERDEFLAEVTSLLAEDLRSNGLVLETVTISRLDQTDDQYLKAENIFDAQGRRKIAEITQLNLTERNRLVREGEQARKQQDVHTRQAVLELDKAEKAAEALQQAEVTKVEAEAARDAHVKRIEAQQKIDLANVEKEKSLEVAARLQEQAVEVAERAKQEKVALAEKERAAAERELADAEADREAARQRVETVRVTEEATREKSRQVIEAEAAAEMGYVTAQREADASAYATQKQAEARQLSASADADATRQQAEAEAEAERLRAAGRKAVEMVPVEVERARVLVDRDRLETVIKPELEAREMHGKVAQDFEVKKLEIEAQKAVRIASAQATASLFTKMEAKLFGTPEEVNKLLASVLGGQSVATAANSFLAAADPKTTSVVDGLAKSLGGIAEAAAKKLGEGRSNDAVESSDTDNHVATESDHVTAVGDDEIEVLDSADDAPEVPAA